MAAGAAAALQMKMTKKPMKKRIRPMKKKENDTVAKYREIAVLSIVPCAVGILILVSWAVAHWGIGPYFLNAGIAIFATLFGGYLRFLAGFKDIFNRKITVNVFVTVALIATVAVGEFRAAKPAFPTLR